MNKVLLLVLFVLGGCEYPGPGEEPKDGDKPQSKTETPTQMARRSPTYTSGIAEYYCVDELSHITITRAAVIDGEAGEPTHVRVFLDGECYTLAVEWDNEIDALEKW